MSLTGTTIYLHNTRRTMAQRLQARKSVGPYQWTVPQAGPSAGRGYYACDDEGTPSLGDCMFILRSCERPARINGWYCDDYQDQTITACVLRLPRGRGFLAGWTMGKGMASTVDFDVYADEADAWHAADSMAESAAEKEREYQEEERAKADAEEEEEPTVDTVLADVQSRLYALANSEADAARRIELMALHSIVGGVVYDAMPK